MMYKIALFIFGLVAAVAVEAATVTYGLPAGQPMASTGTRAANGRLLVNTAQPITDMGYITQVEAYTGARGCTGNACTGTAYAVIFAPTAVTDTYRVTGIAALNFVVNGYTSFSTFLNAPTDSTHRTLSFSGSNGVYAGYLFGLWQPVGGARIDYTNNTGDIWGVAMNDSVSPATPLTITNLQVGASYLFEDITTPREYQYRLTEAVPAPPTLWLFGPVLAGWAASRRRPV